MSVDQKRRDEGGNNQFIIGVAFGITTITGVGNGNCVEIVEFFFWA